ncbi:hypothetical protein [Dactylosporangium sp. NPDC051541]|uniref:hypothetical protein n=1 Tax=Dactylosporangium sp. NPDC051541 TaxID=3363977 RepID=UPI0037AAB829
MATDTRLLAHLTDADSSPSGSWSHYALHPLPAERPPTGRTRAEFACPECGTTVSYSISSAAGARRRSRAWRAVGFLMIALVPLLFLPAYLASGFDRVGFAVLGALMLIVPGLGQAWARDHARDADGLRLLHPNSRHSLRRAGATSDYDMVIEG